MRVAISKVTSQGQISVPAEVRRDLGIHPGTELVWERGEGGEYRVRARRHTLADLHELLGAPQVQLSDPELRAARGAFLASGQRARRAGKG